MNNVKFQIVPTEKTLEVVPEDQQDTEGRKIEGKGVRFSDDNSTQEIVPTEKTLEVVPEDQQDTEGRKIEGKGVRFSDDNSTQENHRPGNGTLERDNEERTTKEALQRAQDAHCGEVERADAGEVSRLPTAHRQSAWTTRPGFGHILYGIHRSVDRRLESGIACAWHRSRSSHHLLLVYHRWPYSLLSRSSPLSFSFLRLFPISSSFLSPICTAGTYVV
ncbi:hypothetical protein OSTOST_13460 [Ostertagia ostertagi]